MQASDPSPIPKSPKIAKPIFKITTDATRGAFNPKDTQQSKETKWTPEEHKTFVEGTFLSIILEGVQKYGRQWIQIHEMIPTKTPTQIRTHAQNFFVKIERVANGADSLEFVRSKPVDFFIATDPQSTLSKKKRQRKDEDKTWPKSGSKNRNDQKWRKVKTEVPADLTFVGAFKLIERQSLPKPNKKLANKQKDKKTKARKEKPKPSEAFPLESQQNLGNSQHIPPPSRFEEQKIPAMPYPSFATVPDQLYAILGEVAKLSQELERDQLSVQQAMESDPEFGYYWKALYGCSVSLQHIVNDMAYIHLSTQPVPPRYVQPTYYPPPMIRPYYPDPRWPQEQI